jgi:hypothetical protein
VTITIQFSKGETLEVKDYSNINVQRRLNHVDVNITVTPPTLALNTLYDKILECRVDGGTFDVIAKTDEGNEANYPRLAVDYYNTGDNEILHLFTADR